MSKFKNYNSDQLFLLPPSIKDFVPAGHLAMIIDQIVESLDTFLIENKYSQLGQKSYHPKLLLKLLFYGYATGVRSGRKIAGKCLTDTAFMFLANLFKPDFRTINDFRKNNIDAFEKIFKDIIIMCKELGMANAGLISIDSTKIRANASGKNSLRKESYDQWEKEIDEQIQTIMKEVNENDFKEDKELGDRQGYEQPEELKKLEVLKRKIQLAKDKIKKEEKVNFEAFAGVITCKPPSPRWRDLS